MVGTLPVAPVQLPIFQNRTYIRFNHIDSSLITVNTITHTSNTDIRTISLPDVKNVICAELYDTDYMFKWEFVDGQLNSKLYTTYQGALTLMVSQPTVTIRYIAI